MENCWICGIQTKERLCEKCYKRTLKLEKRLVDRSKNGWGDGSFYCKDCKYNGKIATHEEFNKICSKCVKGNKRVIKL